MSGKGKTPTTRLAAKAPGCPVSPDPDLRTLIRRADAGEDQARGEIRTLLSKPRTLATSGALRDAAETALLKASHGESWTAQEVGRRTLAQLRRDLAGPNPSPLERALADRLALALAEVDYIAALALPSGIGLDQRESIERRYSRAHARAMSAAKTLATVRRLAANVPAVAVQVNMTGTHRDLSHVSTEELLADIETRAPAAVRPGHTAQAPGEPMKQRSRTCARLHHPACAATVACSP